jgi:hypothetical protein
MSSKNLDIRFISNFLGDAGWDDTTSPLSRCFVGEGEFLWAANAAICSVTLLGDRRCEADSNDFEALPVVMGSGRGRA